MPAPIVPPARRPRLHPHHSPGPWSAALSAGLLFLPFAPVLWAVAHNLQGRTEAAGVQAGLPLALQAAAYGLVLALGLRLRWLLLLLLPFAFVVPWELMHLGMFGAPSGAVAYGALWDAHAEEALSWLGVWLWPLLLAAGAYAGLLLMAARQAWRQDWQWRGRSRAWVLCTALVTLPLLAWVEWGGEVNAAALISDGQNRSWGAGAPMPHDLWESQSVLQRGVEQTFVLGLPLRLHRFVAHQSVLQHHLERAKDFRFDIEPTPPLASPMPQIHVLVIGETARRDRWQLFGAARETTPRLAELADELVVFRDAVSAASATRESIPLMLTARPAHAPLRYTPEPSIVTAMKQAGYSTAWLSNQGASGYHETPVTVMAREADHAVFINRVDYRSSAPFDGELLPHLAQALARPADRKFIVLHTLGSHLHYAKRYPAEFEVFRPALAPDAPPDIRSSDPRHRQLLVNAYDNSVRYTDHVLRELIDLVRATGLEATVTYVPDHGETLFDGSCGMAGHGFASYANYRVPMLMWASPAWRARHGPAWDALRLNATKPVSTLALFPTMTAMAGFSVRKPHAHPSLLEVAASRPPRLVQAYGDFDGAFSRLACDAGAQP